jgi:hypothetical protein
LAALELKQRGWEFHIRFQTWIKKEVTQEYTRGGKQQTKTKTIYFDFENEWRTKTNTIIDIDGSSMQIENELQVPQIQQNFMPNESWQEAVRCLTQENFEQQFSIGSIRTSELSRHVLDQLCQ